MDIHVRRMAGKSSPVTSSHADYWKYYAANHFSEIQSGFTTGSSSATQSIEVNHVTESQKVAGTDSTEICIFGSCHFFLIHRCETLPTPFFVHCKCTSPGQLPTVSSQKSLVLSRFPIDACHLKFQILKCHDHSEIASQIVPVAADSGSLKL